MAEMNATKAPVTEFSLDAKADAVVDLAMDGQVFMYSGDRERFRERMQDAVDALIDECRDYYRQVQS